MTKITRPEILCPVQEHPELTYLDDAGVEVWAQAHNLTLYRDWRGLYATNIADAYRLREALDADRVRQAEAETARRAQAEAEDEARFGAIRRRLEIAAQKAELHKAVEELDVPFADERFKDWEAKADEYGRALFEKALPQSEPDYRTPLQRIKDKEAGL